MQRLGYTEVPADVMDTLTHNAGVVVKTFDPDDPKTGAEMKDDGDILFATTGDETISIVPRTADLGEGINNMPPKTKQLLDIQGYDITYGGECLNLKKDTTAMFIGSADVDDTNEKYTKITPSVEVKEDTFSEIWKITNYGDDNWIALHIYDLFSTGGLTLAVREGKGSNSFELTAMSDITDLSKVPVEIYIGKKTETGGKTDGETGGETGGKTQEA